MSYRPHTSSRRKPGRGRGKVHHEKAKRKGQKRVSGGKYLLEKSEAPAFEEVVEKTLGRLQSLGGQTFAFSPFSQYHDDWLLSLESVLSEFELNPAVNVDEEFVKERSQVIADVELKLAERRREEAVLEEAARRLAEQNNLLVQTDTEHAYETQKLASERKSEIKRLTRRVRDLETELEETSQIKASVFSPFARRAKSHKKAEVTRKLDAAKSELESAVKALEAEQEKLRDECEKKKQAVMEQVRSLEKKVGGSEADGSVEDRRFACEELVNAVKALLQRKTSLQ
jgi:DNA repair exonuclease SbcCD ATPase subunit